MQELVLPLLLHKVLCAKFKLKKHSTVYWLKELLNIISAEQTFASSSYGNMLIATNKVFPQQQLPHCKSQQFSQKLAAQNKSTVIPYALVSKHYANKPNFCILSQLSLANQATLFSFVQLTGIWDKKNILHDQPSSCFWTLLSSFRIELIS